MSHSLRYFYDTEDSYTGMADVTAAATELTPACTIVLLHMVVSRRLPFTPLCVGIVAFMAMSLYWLRLTDSLE
jgi:hypothetical protein